MSTIIAFPGALRDAETTAQAVTPRFSIQAVLGMLSRWMARSRERAALADLAEDRHLLADIGMTREQALREAGKVFWR